MSELIDAIPCPHAKLQILALKKTVIVLQALAKQLGENDSRAEEETKCLGRAVLWAIDKLEAAQ